MAEEQTFEIGLVLAGAISAGAYSAGVVDFLIEALDAYEEEKHKDTWSGPKHDVKLPVMAGASAGGMTAAIAALHLFHRLDHVWPDQVEPKKEYNRLYSSWVTDISFEKLLETKDLNGMDNANRGVRSALCCSVLEDIVQDAFKLGDDPIQRPWVGRDSDPTLTLLLTLTNLRGIPYSFPVAGSHGNEYYGMLNHSDDLEFHIGLSRQPTYKRWLNINHTDDPEWEVFKNAALATGAFPIGLASRRLRREFSDYWRDSHVGSENGGNGLQPDISDGRQGLYEFISVDGGVINNEPFGLARSHLFKGSAKNGGHDGDKANRALLLIDPFPNVRSLPAPDADDRLISIVPKLISTFKDQARFKKDELALAADKRVFSTFMIAPTRTVPSAAKVERAEEFPIACGPLGGFAGFLDKSFRRHDYLLGRRNAQAFLRWHFALPGNNPLFHGFTNREPWYVHDPGEQYANIAAGEDRKYPIKKLAASAESNDYTEALPIIPLVERLKKPIKISGDDLPHPASVQLDVFRKLVRARVDAILVELAEVELKDWGKSLPAIFRLPLKWSYLRRVTRNKVSEYIADLTERKLKETRDQVSDAFGLGRCEK